MTSAATSAFIREATVADCAEIARVHVASWRETYPGLVPDAYLADLSEARRTARWTEAFATAQAPWQTFVSVSGMSGQIDGFVTVGAPREADLGFQGELYSLYLLQAAQGQGTGKNLFEAARNRLKSYGIGTMYLWVLTDNATAGFYRHMGGRDVARKTLDIGGRQLEETAFGWEAL